MTSDEADAFDREAAPSVTLQEVTDDADARDFLHMSDAETDEKAEKDVFDASKSEVSTHMNGFIKPKHETVDDCGKSVCACITLHLLRLRQTKDMCMYA